MRKVINGKMYNTDTAEEIWIFDNGFFENDLRWYAETLYQKTTGEFFLYQRGGAASPYAEYYGECRGRGEYIEPITEKQAAQWLEKHANADTYEKVFGVVEE